jgi:hypothetical protein
MPADLPGDTLGNVTVFVMLNENSGYGTAETSQVLKAGKPTPWVPLTAPRAMWNVRSKAPVWLILAYSLAVTGVFITLFFIAFRIKKIYDIGKSSE